VWHTAADLPSGKDSAAVRLRLCLLSSSLCLLALPGVANARLVVGISDQRAATFASPLYAPLKLKVARYITPFDVTKDPVETRKLAEWLTSASAAGQEILISFEHSRRSRAAAAKLPSPALYRKSITAFKALYGQYVTDVSPWNEVDKRLDKQRGEGQPTWDEPVAAARFYGIAREVFPRKRIVALDVLDQPRVDAAVAYIGAFRQAVAQQGLPAPKIWGLHPYSDINRFSTSRTKALLKATGSGDVWLTEASGIVRFGTSFPFDLDRAARADRCMFTIAKLSSRIKRLYVFGWMAGGTFDSGMVDELGPRPAYAVVRDRKAGRCG
jgi:hypothetical protein